jgi:hypothetical protein
VPFQRLSENKVGVARLTLAKNCPRVKLEIIAGEKLRIVHFSFAYSFSSDFN